MRRGRRYTWYNWLPKVLMIVLYENTAYVYFIVRRRPLPPARTR